VHLLEEAVHLGFLGQRDPCHLVLQSYAAVSWDSRDTRMIPAPRPPDLRRLGDST
jgi:hypothetical protein